MVKKLNANDIAKILDLTFPWRLELVFLRDIMIYGIRKSLILREVFHLKKKKSLLQILGQPLGHPP